MAVFDWEWGRNSAPRDGQKRPCNGYETISFGDDFMGQRQIVHSIPDAPLLWCLIRAYFCKKKKVIEEVSRRQSS